MTYIYKLILLSIIIFIAVMANAIPCFAQGDISSVIKHYGNCTDRTDCIAKENDIITSLISSYDLFEMLEEKPKLADLDYKFIKCNISSHNNDLLIKIVYGRVGYLVIFAWDNLQYKLLPIINTGYVSKVSAIDLFNDGTDMIVVNGYATGTGYSSKWTAIYKFHDSNMKLVWSGDTEFESIDVNGKITSGIYDLKFKSENVHSTTAKIFYAGCEKTYMNGNDNLIDKKCVNKVFNWSSKKSIFEQSE